MGLIFFQRKTPIFNGCFSLQGFVSEIRTLYGITRQWYKASLGGLLTYRLIALLDRPANQSFGMVAFLVEEANTGRLVVYGLTKGPTPLVLPESMAPADFIRVNCRNVEAQRITFATPPEEHCAGWLGTDFLDACQQLGIPEPLIPAQVHSFPNAGEPQRMDGVFWIEAPAPLYARLESWLHHAAASTFQKRCRKSAKLMAWCLPLHLETETALWYTAENPEAQERELQWRLQLRKHAEPGLTKRALTTQFKTIIRQFIPGAFT